MNNSILLAYKVHCVQSRHRHHSDPKRAEAATASLDCAAAHSDSDDSFVFFYRFWIWNDSNAFHKCLFYRSHGDVNAQSFFPKFTKFPLRGCVTTRPATLRFLNVRAAAKNFKSPKSKQSLFRRKRRKRSEDKKDKSPGGLRRVEETASKMTSEAIKTVVRFRVALPREKVSSDSTS